MENRGNRHVRSVLSCLIAAVALLALSCFAILSGAATPSLVSAAQAMPGDEFQPNPAASPSSVIVHPKFGGQILGYDIDRNGTVGLLSEYVSLGGGANLVATETFDQKTGAILKVIAKENKTTRDDYVTEGIFGNLGLDLFQHSDKNQVIQNHFLTIHPLNAGKFTGKWTPPIKKGYQLWTISASQGTPNVAAYQFSFNTGRTYVFSSNVAANTFGPQIQFKGDNFIGNFPVLAYDSKTNQAVLSGSIGCRTCTPEVAVVDLATGKSRKFTGVGLGTVNGIAVDSNTGIACTTTEN